MKLIFNVNNINVTDVPVGMPPGPIPGGSRPVMPPVPVPHPQPVAAPPPHSRLIPPNLGPNPTSDQEKVTTVLSSNQLKQCTEFVRLKMRFNRINYNSYT